MKNVSYRFLQFCLKIALFMYDDLSKGYPIIQSLLDIASFYQDIAYIVTAVIQ